MRRLAERWERASLVFFTAWIFGQTLRLVSNPVAKNIKSAKYLMPMGTSSNENERNNADQIVPAGWTRALTTHWKATHLASVEARKGPKGSLRCLKVEVLEDAKDDEREVHELAEVVAQSLYDKAYSWHLEVGGTVDAQLVLVDEKGDEIARVKQGGRMRGGETEDPEETEGGQTLRTSLWAIEKITRLHVKTVEQFNRFIETLTPYMAQVGQVEAARVGAEADVMKAQMVEDIVSRASDRFGPILDKWADAKFQESMSGRRRRPAGDAVIDAWRDVLEAVDGPAIGKLRAHLPPAAYSELFTALTEGDTFGRSDIIEFWKHFRGLEGVAEEWKSLLAALPERARRALPTLADAIRESDSRRTREQTVRE